MTIMFLLEISCKCGASLRLTADVYRREWLSLESQKFQTLHMICLEPYSLGEPQPNTTSEDYPAIDMLSHHEAKERGFIATET